MSYTTKKNCKFGQYSCGINELRLLYFVKINALSFFHPRISLEMHLIFNGTTFLFVHKFFFFYSVKIYFSIDIA